MWSPAARLAPHRVPEIHRVDLSEMVLEVACAGLSVERLPLVDPPRGFALEDARRRLEDLGALDASGRVTRTGRRMSRLPVDPRMARLLVEALDRGEPRLVHDAVDLAAALSSPGEIFRDGVREGECPGREEYEDVGCDLHAHVHALRHADPRVHGLNAPALHEARRTARSIRRHLGLGGAPAGGVDRFGLARLVLAAWPDSGFVPQRRRGTFGNGRVQVELARESFASAKSRALVVARRRSIKRRRRTVDLATVAGPVEPELLARHGHGRRELAGVRLEEGRMVGTVERVVAGTVVDRQERELTGRDAVRGAARLVMRGEVLGGAWRAVVDDVEAHDLAMRLEGGRAAGVDAEAWLEERLAELGVERGEDLSLLAAGDLRFGGLSSERRERLDREYPRRLDLGDQVVEVRYDLEASIVTMTHVEGVTRTAPSEFLLPRWPGLRVLYVHKGRTTPVR
jgi:HrpA-like RNA helicase